MLRHKQLTPAFWRTRIVWTLMALGIVVTVPLQSAGSEGQNLDTPSPTSSLIQQSWARPSLIKSGHFEFEYEKAIEQSDGRAPVQIKRKIEALLDGDKVLLMSRGDGFEADADKAASIANADPALLRSGAIIGKLLDEGTVNVREEYAAFLATESGIYAYNREMRTVAIMTDRHEGILMTTGYIDPRTLGLPSFLDPQALGKSGVDDAPLTTETINGSELTKAEWVNPSGLMWTRIWVDPTTSTIVKAEREAKDTGVAIKQQLEVDAGVDVATGIPYPKSVKTSMYDHDKLVFRECVKVVKASLNVPVEASEISLAAVGMMPGTHVFDKKSGAVLGLWRNGRIERPQTGATISPDETPLLQTLQVAQTTRPASAVGTAVALNRQPVAVQSADHDHKLVSRRSRWLWLGGVVGGATLVAVVLALSRRWVSGTA